VTTEAYTLLHSAVELERQPIRPQFTWLRTNVSCFAFLCIAHILDMDLGKVKSEQHKVRNCISPSAR